MSSSIKSVDQVSLPMSTRRQTRIAQNATSLARQAISTPFIHTPSSKAITRQDSTQVIQQGAIDCSNHPSILQLLQFFSFVLKINLGYTKVPPPHTPLDPSLLKPTNALLFQQALQRLLTPAPVEQNKETLSQTISARSAYIAIKIAQKLDIEPSQLAEYFQNTNCSKEEIIAIKEMIVHRIEKRLGKKHYEITEEGQELLPEIIRLRLEEYNNHLNPLLTRLEILYEAVMTINEALFFSYVQITLKNEGHDSLPFVIYEDPDRTSKTPPSLIKSFLNAKKNYHPLSVTPYSIPELRGERGVIAIESIQLEEFVLFYVGVLENDENHLGGHEYVYEYGTISNEFVGLQIEGRNLTTGKALTLAGMINHTEDANCLAKCILWVSSREEINPNDSYALINSLRKGYITPYIGLQATSSIPRGTVITLNYGPHYKFPKPSPVDGRYFSEVSSLFLEDFLHFYTKEPAIEGVHHLFTLREKTGALFLPTIHNDGNDWISKQELVLCAYQPLQPDQIVTSLPPRTGWYNKQIKQWSTLKENKSIIFSRQGSKEAPFIPISRSYLWQEELMKPNLYATIEKNDQGEHTLYYRAISHIEPGTPLIVAPDSELVSYIKPISLEKRIPLPLPLPAPQSIGSASTPILISDSDDEEKDEDEVILSRSHSAFTPRQPIPQQQPLSLPPPLPPQTTFPFPMMPIWQPPYQPYQPYPFAMPYLTPITPIYPIPVGTPIFPLKRAASPLYYVESPPPKRKQRKPRGPVVQIECHPIYNLLTYHSVKEWLVVLKNAVENNQIAKIEELISCLRNPLTIDVAWKDTLPSFLILLLKIKTMALLPPREELYTSKEIRERLLADAVLAKLIPRINENNIQPHLHAAVRIQSGDADAQNLLKEAQKIESDLRLNKAKIKVTEYQDMS